MGVDSTAERAPQQSVHFPQKAHQQEAQLHARLSARQFVAQVVLQTVLSSGGPVSSAVTAAVTTSDAVEKEVPQKEVSISRPVASEPQPCSPPPPPPNTSPRPAVPKPPSPSGSGAAPPPSPRRSVASRKGSALDPAATGRRAERRASDVVRRPSASRQSTEAPRRKSVAPKAPSPKKENEAPQGTSTRRGVAESTQQDDDVSAPSEEEADETDTAVMTEVGDGGCVAECAGGARAFWSGAPGSSPVMLDQWQVLQGQWAEPGASEAFSQTAGMQGPAPAAEQWGETSASPHLGQGSCETSHCAAWTQHVLSQLPYLEAKVSGEHLGQLAAGPFGREFQHWQPVTLSLDVATAELLLALSGKDVVLPQYGGTFLDGMADEDGMSDAISAPVESEESFASSRRTSLRRLAASRREMPTDEPDLFILKARNGNGSQHSTAGRDDGTILQQQGSMASTSPSPQAAATRRARSRTKSRGEDATATYQGATGLQVKSVKLLQGLPPCADVMAQYFEQDRGQSSKVQSTSSSRPSTGTLKPDRPKPEWDASFVNCLDRRIPAYDALLDAYCPIMTHPARLQHLVDTRELSAEFLHIVRARFEEHRRLYDFQGQLGARKRPEPPPTTDPPRSVPMPPETFESRMEELLDDDKKVKLTRLPELWARPNLVCSPDWSNSALHHDCLRNLEGDGREVPGMEADLFGLPPRSSALNDRWRSISDAIQTLWQELQTPLPVRQVFREGALLKATPDTVYQLEVHFKELLDYRSETKQLIFDIIEWESVGETLRHTTALCLGDERLQTIQMAVARLDTLSVEILRCVGCWARRFKHLIVDRTRYAAMQTSAPDPPAVFVWGGRDCAEIVHTHCQAVVNGDPHGVKAGRSSAQGLRPASGPSKERATTAPAGGRRQRSARADLANPVPLVTSTLTGQRQAVLDVLHPGPPPPWYSRQVAEAGIQKIRRQRDVQFKYAHTGGVGRARSQKVQR